MVRVQSWEEFRKELMLVFLAFNLWLCIFLIFRTRYRIFHLQEKKEEEPEEN